MCYAPVGGATVALGYGSLALLGAVAAAGLSTLPDVDEVVPGVRHRGLTHTVWFALAVGVVLGVATAAVGGGQRPRPTYGVAAWAFTVGVLTVCSHLLADAVTPAGVRPFAPLSNRWLSVGLTPSANVRANRALLVVGVLVLGVALAVGRVLARSSVG